MQKLFQVCALIVLANNVNATTTYENPHKVFLRNGCVACHGSSKSYLGISYEELITKYQGKQETADKLKKFIRNGGSWNRFTEMGMPAQTLITDEDLDEIVRILVGLGADQN